MPQEISAAIMHQAKRIREGSLAVGDFLRFQEKLDEIFARRAGHLKPLPVHLEIAVALNELRDAAFSGFSRDNPTFALLYEVLSGIEFGVWFGYLDSGTLLELG